MAEKIKITLDNEQKLKIELLDKDVKFEVTKGAYGVFKTFQQMMLWFADESVPQSEKDKFAESKINLMRSMGIMVTILECAGYDSKQIDEIFVLPF